MNYPEIDLGISDDEAIMVRIDYLDASALVKVFSHEERSEVVRDYLRQRGSPTTTSFCLYETLSILKGKTRKKRGDPLFLDWKGYLQACQLVLDFYRAHVGPEYQKDPTLTDPDSAEEVMTIALKYTLDLSDALQVLSVKKGVAAGFARGSQTILVTADGWLRDAAVAEGLRVWYVYEDLPADAHVNSFWALGGKAA